MNLVRTIGVGGGLVAVALIGYYIGKRGNGDDQPIVVTGGSFEIQTSSGHNFVLAQDKEGLDHTERNRVLTWVEITSKGPDDKQVFRNGPVDIEIGYCNPTHDCIYPAKDEGVRFHADADRKNLHIFAKKGQINDWNQIFSYMWERLPRQHHMKWIKISTVADPYICPDDGKCSLRLHHEKP